MPKCDSCGQETHLPFDCPYCGGSFCSDHRLPPAHHCENEGKWRARNPFSGTASPGHGPAGGSTAAAPQPGPGASPPAAPPSKLPGGWPGIAVVVIVLIIVGGGVVIAGKLSHAGPGTPDIPGTPASVTTGTAGMPPTTPPTMAQTTVPQLVAETITVPSPTPIVTTATATVTKSPTVTPTTIKTPAVRPSTGTIVAGKALYGGMGKMTIDNSGGSSDVVAILTKGNAKKTLIGVYIRKGDSTALSAIADGTYAMYVHAGGNWDPAAKRFTDNADSWKFEDPILFTSNQIVSGSTQHTSWTVKIYPSLAGNAESVTVSEAEFPDL